MRKAKRKKKKKKKRTKEQRKKRDKKKKKKRKERVTSGKSDLTRQVSLVNECLITKMYITQFFIT